MTRKAGGERDAVLVAAAEAVLAALRVPLETRQLTTQATASLRLLESALEAYSKDEPGRR